MKKKMSLLLAGMLCLTGCGHKDETAPVLELTKQRVQVGVNSEVDYLSYVEKAEDENDGNLISTVNYDEIDTSKVGQSEITYTVKDKSGNESKQTLIVDVVKYFKNGIYSPLNVTPDTVENPEDITVLVNKVHQIPEGWTPNDLESVPDNKNQKLRKEANEAYTKFYKAAKAKGIEIYSISGYRTNKTQKTYWDNQVKAYGEEYASQYSAYPGRSEHQLGLAIDVSYTTEGDRLNEKVATSSLGKFIVSDAYKYGFILRYTKDKVAITNYAYEPWHMRYVGVDLATQLHESGLTLEEYYKQ